MSRPLPPLRNVLDLMPSPVPERPGLLMRDPYNYTEAVLILPPLLARMLPLFDGEHDDGDLRAELSRLTGEVEVGEVADQMLATLDDNGFLESEAFHAMREAKHRAFAESDVKQPAHAGSAYPADPSELSATFDGYVAQAADAQAAPPNGNLIGLAAPHVSPEGGFQSYAAAYRRLTADYADKTFIILGTSHYGEPEKFGLTRKPYETPLGTVETDRALVDRLAAAAPDSIVMEDYCHASEHSIEFQSVFLQYALGGALPQGERLRAVPILCGSFVRSLYTGKPPEDDEQVRRFLGELADLAASRDDLVWILGVDMAHIGRRYGDDLTARSFEGPLAEVAQRDRARIDRIEVGDAHGFFELVQPNHDDLRWCGYAPIYTFLQTVQGVQGKTLSYEQWNIDEQSVVSFVGAEFLRC